MSEALEEKSQNPSFADDIDGLVGSEQEVKDLIQLFSHSLTTFGMETSAEKTKRMTNKPEGFQESI